MEGDVVLLVDDHLLGGLVRVALEDESVVQVAGTDATKGSVPRSRTKSGRQVHHLHRLYRNAGFESERLMEFLKRLVIISDSCEHALGWQGLL